MGKFHQILTEFSARDMPIFSFPDDNMSKHQWIFIKLGSALILWRPGLRLLMSKFCQILMELSAQNMPILLFLGNE